MRLLQNSDNAEIEIVSFGWNTEEQRMLPGLSASGGLRHFLACGSITSVSVIYHLVFSSLYLCPNFSLIRIPVILDQGLA